MHLQSKGTAFITGASSGIGEEFARQLAQRRLNLVLLGRREEKLRSLSGELAAEFGVAATYLVADLATEDGIVSAERAINDLEDLEFLINNAGFGIMGYFHESPSELEMTMVRVHVEAAVRLTHAAIGRMLERRSGAIINVSSVAGYLRTPGSANYCATKAYLTAFSECIAGEVEECGIRVQAVCPGFTHTEFHRRKNMGEFDKAKVPGFMWYDAQFVVTKSLKALDRNKVVCIPGWFYKLIVWLNRSSIARPLIASVASKRRANMRAERKPRAGE